MHKHPYRLSLGDSSLGLPIVAAGVHYIPDLEDLQKVGKQPPVDLPITPDLPPGAKPLLNLLPPDPKPFTLPYKTSTSTDSATTPKTPSGAGLSPNGPTP